MRIFSLVVFLLILIISPNFAFSETLVIPQWVKNNAGWWANSQIPDSAFIDGIEYLIKVGILSISTPSDKFQDFESWSTFDFGNYGVGVNPEGYRGAVSDGKYVYFVPYYNGQGRHGEVLRYDTTLEFETVGAWSTFDAAANGVGDDPRGYAGAVFDGKYIYFAPFRHDEEMHGEVLRYDTTLEFETVGAWSTFDAAANGVGDDPRGYAGAGFDGKYIYFAPNIREVQLAGLVGTDYHGEVLRYDTNQRP